MARNARRAVAPVQISIRQPPAPTAAARDPRALCAELMRWERCHQHMVVDARGNVATAIGHMLPNADAAVLLAWRHRGTGHPATRGEVRTAFDQVRAQGPGHRSIAYRFASDLVLAGGVAVDLVVARVERDLLPGLRRLFPEFDRYPLPAQRALVDMGHDVGLMALGKFRNLIAACGRRDFATAAEHCRRRTTRQIRNAATKILFQQASICG